LKYDEASRFTKTSLTSSSRKDLHRPDRLLWGHDLLPRGLDTSWPGIPRAGRIGPLTRSTTSRKMTIPKGPLRLGAARSWQPPISSCLSVTMAALARTNLLYPESFTLPRRQENLFHRRREEGLEFSSSSIRIARRRFRLIGVSDR
jgi:hypothetical protein